MKKTYLIGVDGGNTKTDYLLFSSTGDFIDGIRSTTCSHEALADSYEGSYRVMKSNLDDLLKRNNIDYSDIVGAAFGLAGADVPIQKQNLKKVIERIGFKNFIVENDGFLGLKAASPNGKGVCSINGTGTVNVGIGDDDGLVQVGGVGYISGDEAGGAYLVRRTFQAVYDELYRLGTPTSLTADIMSYYGIVKEEDFLSTIVEITGNRKLDRTIIIKKLFAHANNNDQVAIDILNKAGSCMGQSIAGCISKLKFSSTINVILAGSVWANAGSPHMLDAFKNKIESLIDKKYQYYVLKVAPVSGAIIWAYELANGYYPSEELKANILLQVEKYQIKQKQT